MILLNGAGGSAGDSTLNGLAAEFVFASPSMDVASLSGVWLDQAAGFPGTNSVLSSVSPLATVLTSGNNAAYNDTSKRLNIGSTTGLSAGDYLYMDASGISAGVYKILAVASASEVTFVVNPFNGGGDRSGVAFQVAWRYTAVLGTAPLASSPSGQINYFKVEAADAASNVVQAVDSTYIQDAPTGSAYIAIQSKSYTGSETVNTLTETFSLLGAWLNNGGVSHIALANHSVQGVNNFTWGDNSTGEKTTAAAESGGLKVSAGDGMKYARLLLRDASGSSNAVGVDIAIGLDTTAPTLTMFLFGR